MYKNCIVDVSYVVSKIYFAIARDKEPKPQEVLKIFFNMVKRIKLTFEVQRFFYAMEGETNFRSTIIDPNYKANRPDKDEVFKNSMELIEFCLLNGLGVYAYKVDGYEADDVIATLCSGLLFEQTNLIVSGDKDLLQLINSNTHMIQGVGKEKHVLTKEDDVISKYDIIPQKISDYLALVGDSSDNFKGIFGVGPKKAAALLNILDNYTTIIEHGLAGNLGVVDKKTSQAIQDMDDPFLPLKLATLEKNVKIELVRCPKDINIINKIKSEL